MRYAGAFARYAAVVVIAAAIAGCESESEGYGDGGTAALQPLVGHYVLVGFTVVYDAGGSLTQNDFPGQYEGTMQINSDGTLVQSMSLRGSSAVYDGTVSVTSADSLTIYDSGTGRSITATYVFDGMILTTTEQNAFDGYQETDVWQKVG